MFNITDPFQFICGQDISQAALFSLSEPLKNPNLDEHFSLKEELYL